jgi:hypothetical protein
MASAMQLYAAFALLTIAVIAIIVLAALVSNLIGTLRRQFGRTQAGAPRAHDDLLAPAKRSRSDSGASRTATVSPSDNPPRPAD